MDRVALVACHTASKGLFTRGLQRDNACNEQSIQLTIIKAKPAEHLAAVLAEGRRWPIKRQRQVAEIPERANLLQLAVHRMLIVGMQASFGMLRVVEKWVELRLKNGVSGHVVCAQERQRVGLGLRSEMRLGIRAGERMEPLRFIRLQRCYGDPAITTAICQRRLKSDPLCP